jgi:hypothetical protein
MSQFVRTRIRCAIYPAKVGESFIVVAVGGTPKIYKGTGVQFEFAFFDGDALFDVSNMASVTVSVKQKGHPEAVPSMLKTIAAPNINTGLELTQWQSGAGQHVIVPFTALETSIDATTDYDITVSGFTNDDLVDADVYGTSTLKLIDAGITNLTNPPAGGSPAASIDDIKGLLAGYVKRLLDKGDTITFQTANGKRRILGAADDPADPNAVIRVDDIELP